MVVRVAGQLALQASRGGFLGRLLEAAAGEALLTALLGRFLETGAFACGFGFAFFGSSLTIAFACGFSFAFFGSSRIARGVLIIGLSSS